MFDPLLQRFGLLLIVPLIITGMISDFKHRKLPNKITVAITLLALMLHSVLDGWAGLWSAALGFAMGFGILLPFYVFRMLGAGDIKFLGALGAFVGHDWVLQASAAGVILAGICSLLIILTRSSEEAAGRWAVISAKFSSFRLMMSDFGSHNMLATSQRAVPYGIYLGIAAIGTGLYRAWAVA